MNDEDRILEDIKEILKELDEQGRMNIHRDICSTVIYPCISIVSV